MDDQGIDNRTIEPNRTAKSSCTLTAAIKLQIEELLLKVHRCPFMSHNQVERNLKFVAFETHQGASLPLFYLVSHSFPSTEMKSDIKDVSETLFGLQNQSLKRMSSLHSHMLL